MKKHIGYKIEAGSDFDMGFYYVGYITYFDGEQIVITQSDRCEDRKDAWRWIGQTLKSLDEEKV